MDQSQLGVVVLLLVDLLAVGLLVVVGLVIVEADRILPAAVVAVRMDFAAVLDRGWARRSAEAALLRGLEKAASQLQGHIDLKELPLKLRVAAGTARLHVGQAVLQTEEVRSSQQVEHSVVERRPTMEGVG